MPNWSVCNDLIENEMLSKKLVFYAYWLRVTNNWIGNKKSSYFRPYDSVDWLNNSK